MDFSCPRNFREVLFFEVDAEPLLLEMNKRPRGKSTFVFSKIRFKESNRYKPFKKEIKMENKKIKKVSKNSSKIHSIRVCDETFKMFDEFKDFVNKTKKFKGTIPLGPIVKLAASLLHEDHAKVLHKSALKNSDRQKFLQQKYSELYGSDSMEDYIGFTMTFAYTDFLKEYGDIAFH